MSWRIPPDDELVSWDDYRRNMENFPMHIVQRAWMDEVTDARALMIYDRMKDGADRMDALAVRACELCHLPITGGLRAFADELRQLASYYDDTAEALSE